MTVVPNFVQVIRGTGVTADYLFLRFEGLKEDGVKIAATLLLNAKDADGLGKALVDQAKVMIVTDRIIRG